MYVHIIPDLLRLCLWLITKATPISYVQLDSSVDQMIADYGKRLQNLKASLHKHSTTRKMLVLLSTRVFVLCGISGVNTLGQLTSIWHLLFSQNWVGVWAEKRNASRTNGKASAVSVHRITWCVCVCTHANVHVSQGVSLYCRYRQLEKAKSRGWAPRFACACAHTHTHTYTHTHTHTHTARVKELKRHIS